MKISLLALIAAFFLSLCFCALLIPLLRKMKAGQNILSYVKEHKNKNGTPTMGGLAFVLAAVFTAVCFIKEAGRITVLSIAIGLAYMIVGLLDDCLKWKKKENMGLTALQKFLFQLAIALFAGIFCFRSGLTSIYLPFTKYALDIGFWVLPLTAFVFIATVNAVNLTDGLDGLAAGASAPFFATVGILIALQNGAFAITTLCFCIVGALFAYLLFNVSPATVFMGDTGSLALGGFAACVSVFTGNTLYIAVIGLPFVLSVLSVIVQVLYYKATGGKRIFLMAPLHHHFQEKGFSESKIAFSYSVATLLLGVICIIFNL